MTETDLVRCLTCHEEFVTDQGRRCPDCCRESQIEWRSQK